MQRGTALASSSAASSSAASSSAVSASAASASSASSAASATTTPFAQRKAGIIAALNAQVNDKSPKGSLDAPIADLVNEMNACPLFYTTSSCSGRITLFLDRRAPGGTGTQSKGGEWLLITHGTVEWADLHRALYETFPARLRKDRAIANTSDADGNSNQSEPEAKAEPEAMAKAEPETEAGALTLRFEPFILAVECASIDAASRMLRVAANAGFRESGISAVDKRFIVSVRCSIRLEVPLWDPDEARLSSANSSANPLSSSSQSASDSAASALPSASSLDPTVSALASSSSLPSSLSPSSSALAPPPSAKLLVDETYLRFLLDSANRKYATNEARICVFHRMYRAAFTDAALLRSLPHIPGGADAIAADVSETREGDTFADDASLASAQQQSQQQQQAQPQSLVTTAAAAAAMATLLGHTSSSSSSTAPLTSTERVWALAAPLRCSRLVQDAVRARDFRRLELKLVTLPSAAPTHIVIPLNQRAVDAIRRRGGSCFDALFVAPPPVGAVGAIAAPSSAKPAKAKPVRAAPKTAAAAVPASATAALVTAASASASASTDSSSASMTTSSSAMDAASAATAVTKSTAKAPESAESIAARTPTAADLWVAEWPVHVFGGTAQPSVSATAPSSAAAVASGPVAARRQRVDISGGASDNGIDNSTTDAVSHGSVAELPANASPYRRLVAAVRALIAPHLSSVLALLRSANADGTAAAEASGAAASVGSSVDATAESYTSEAALCAHMLGDVPKRWEQLGDVALLPRKSFRSRAWALALGQDAALNLASQLWQAVATALRVNRVGRQDEIAPDGVRSSQVVLLHPPRTKSGTGTGTGTGTDPVTGTGNGPVTGTVTGTGSGTGSGADTAADDQVDGWVTHRENGVVFCLDVTRVMFSSGNGTEKQRLVASMLRRQRRAAQWRALNVAPSSTSSAAVSATVQTGSAVMNGAAAAASAAAATSAVSSAATASSSESAAASSQSSAAASAESSATSAIAAASVDTDASCGETLLDLYTGIGYFSMPALVHTNVAHVHMAEWNPHAVAAIRRNVEANRVAAERYTVYPGDNRELALSCVADRVSLGLIPSSEGGWPVALRCVPPHRQPPAGAVSNREPYTSDDADQRIEAMAIMSRAIAEYLDDHSFSLKQIKEAVAGTQSECRLEHVSEILARLMCKSVSQPL